MKNDLGQILPTLTEFLEKIEPMAKDFPVCCEKSSIFLHSWLMKHGVENEIAVGFYPDPIKNHETIHIWVATEESVVDGSAVQFALDNYDNLPRKCTQLRVQIGKTPFVYAKNSRKYKKCVNAYIPPELKEIITMLIENTGTSFSDFINDAEQILNDNLALYTEAMQYFVCSNTYKLDNAYYETPRYVVVGKLLEQNIAAAGHYTRQLEEMEGK